MFIGWSIWELYDWIEYFIKNQSEVNRSYVNFISGPKTFAITMPEGWFKQCDFSLSTDRIDDPFCFVTFGLS